MEKLVSIIIPAYEVEPWIERCLHSVTEQTYRMLEIIVIDDGSRDGTGMLCDEMAVRDSRIRVIHQENKGVSAARNRGIAAARGSRFCFVDADDYLSPDYVEMLYNAMEQYEVQLAVCGYTEVSETGLVRRVLRRSGDIYGSDEILEALFFHDEIGRSLWNKMLDGEVIRNSGLMFSEEYMVGEDLLFFMQYLGRIQQAAVIDGTGYYYMWRVVSAMQKKYWDDGYYKSRSSWLRAIDAAEVFLHQKSKRCQRVFSWYKLLVHYRILCESVSLGRDTKDERRLKLERSLKSYVRRHGIRAVCSGMIPLKTAVGILLCCITPKLQTAVANVRRL